MGQKVLGIPLIFSYFIQSTAGYLGENELHIAERYITAVNLILLST